MSLVQLGWVVVCDRCERYETSGQTSQTAAIRQARNAGFFRRKRLWMCDHCGHLPDPKPVRR